MKIKNDKMNEIPSLQIGDGKEEKPLKIYAFLKKIGDRVLGAFYINFKF